MVWKFTDPPNLGVYALADVLEQPASLRSVIHEVVGDWQFLDGHDVGDRDAKLVCLKDVVALDASISELADLPLGWCATRGASGTAWAREPMVPLDWEELLGTAIDYAQQCQARLESEFRMMDWERFDLDQESGQFTWSSNGTVRVRANMRFAGTLSLTSETWLWSWANDTILEQARRDVEWLEAFGRENDLIRLVHAKGPAEEADAWELASVACYLLQADGVYRAPSEDVHSFLVLDDVRWAN